jgi:hypothetical protein
MTQISRPFQIALAVLVLFVAVWFLALRGHSSGASSSEPSTAAVSTPSASSDASASSSAAARKSAVHKANHAAAQSTGALKHTIVKARGALKHSSASTHAKGAAKSSAAVKSAASSKSAAAASVAKLHAATHAKASTASANTQKVVEAQLKQGKVVAVLFWNPKGTVDGVVHREVQAASSASHGGLVVHVARATEIGAFGSFTRAVQVYGTPTILLINPKGQTSSVSGLTDAFGIEQAVREVKRAK